HYTYPGCVFYLCWLKGRGCCSSLVSLEKASVHVCVGVGGRTEKGTVPPYLANQEVACPDSKILGGTIVDDLGHISQWSSIMAGSLAGMVSTIVTYPTDLIKTRLIVQNMLEPSYRGLLHAFSTIYQQEGFLALYRGVSLTVVGALPFSAGSLLVHMNLEKIWNGPRDQFSLPQNFANVCLAAAVTQTLSFPFETVKRKMQAQSPYLPHSGGVDVHFSGAVDCFRQIVKAQGILGLWNGLTANLLKIAPYFGIMFSTFEFCKRICLYQNGYILSPLSYKLTPGVDQSLQPQELRELKKFFKTRKLKSKKPTL
uniref:Solute carrier family 25 member 43 n=1 Tax=Mandrillus leucophaeus TaxID=9568 RepID=A0A2K5YUK1_MANLE